MNVLPEEQANRPTKSGEQPAQNDLQRKLLKVVELWTFNAVFKGQKVS